MFEPRPYGRSGAAPASEANLRAYKQPGADHLAGSIGYVSRVWSPPEAFECSHGSLTAMFANPDIAIAAVTPIGVEGMIFWCGLLQRRLKGENHEPSEPTSNE